MGYWLLVRQKTKSGDWSATCRMDIHQTWANSGLNPWSTPLSHYTNDTVNNIGSDILLFADEPSILKPIIDTIWSIAKVNRDLEKLSNWDSQWYIRFNPTKTKYIIICKKTERPIYGPFRKNNCMKWTTTNTLAALHWTMRQHGIITFSLQGGCQTALHHQETTNITLHTNMDIYCTFITQFLEYRSIIFNNYTKKYQSN